MILRFVHGLDRFLRDRSLYFDLSSYRLHGNIKHIEGDSAVLDVEVTALLEEFRQDLDWLEPVEGAADALRLISRQANIVVLSNVPEAQAGARTRNLASCRMDFPLVCNSGPKGPAVKELSARAGRPVFFIDDIGPNLVSVAESAPHVFRIHLVGDERLKSVVPVCEQAHLRAADWDDAREFILARLAEAD